MRSEKFRELLTKAIYQIRAHENGKAIGAIQDELGYDLGKNGGSMVEHWRKGVVPRMPDLESLTQELIRRGRLTREWAEDFLEAAEHPYMQGFCDQLFPKEMEIPDSTANPSIQIQLLPNKPHRTLIGRESLVDEALTALNDRSGRWLISLDGVGGIGKTALAHEVVEESLKRGLFEGVLWMSPVLYGHPDQVEQSQGGSFFLEVLLDTILYQLEIPSNVELTRMEKEIRVQRFLRSKRILLVLDNLETAFESQHDLAQKLQTWLGPSKAILISRHRFIRESYALHLEGLTQSDAFDLIMQEAKERRIQSVSNVQREALEELITTTGASPLALKLLLGQLAHLPIQAVLKRLQGIKSFKDTPNGDIYRQLYQSIYQPSWEALSDGGKHLLITLSLFTANVSGTVEIIEQMSGFSDEDEVLDAINELWQFSLIERTPFDIELQQFRYYVHTLMQHFVIADAIQWYRQDEDRSEDRFFTLYQQTLRRGVHYLLNRIQSENTEMLSTNEHYLALNLLNHAFQLPDDWPTLSQLLVQLAPQMEQAGHRDQWRVHLERGIEQSQLRQDTKIEAELNLQLGFLYHLQSDFAMAHHLFRLSTTGFESIGDTDGQARAMIRQAQTCRYLDHHQEASRLVESALQYLDSGDIECVRAYALQGKLAYDHEEWKVAANFYRQAIALCNIADDKHLIAQNLTNLGAALRPQGRLEEAIDCYNQAIALLEDRVDLNHKAITLMNLGNIHFERQEPNKALALYQQAQVIFDDTHNELQLARVRYNSGIAHESLKNWKAAEALYQLSIQGYQHAGATLSQVNTIMKLGLIYKRQKQYQKAGDRFQEALELLDSISDGSGHESKREKIQQHLQEIRKLAKETDGEEH